MKHPWLLSAGIGHPAPGSDRKMGTLVLPQSQLQETGDLHLGLNLLIMGVNLGTDLNGCAAGLNLPESEFPDLPKSDFLDLPIRFPKLTKTSRFPRFATISGFPRFTSSSRVPRFTRFRFPRFASQ